MNHEIFRSESDVWKVSREKHVLFKICILYYRIIAIGHGLYVVFAIKAYILYHDLMQHQGTTRALRISYMVRKMHVWDGMLLISPIVCLIRTGSPLIADNNQYQSFPYETALGTYRKVISNLIHKQCLYCIYYCIYPMYDNKYDNVLVALVRYRNNIPQTNWLYLRSILFEKKKKHSLLLLLYIYMISLTFDDSHEPYLKILVYQVQQ